MANQTGPGAGTESALKPEMHEHLTTGLVTLIVLGAGAQLVAYRVRVPSILVLLIVGVLAGPVFGIVVPDELLGEITFPLVSVGAALILFEGGLSARFQDLKAIQAPVWRLIGLGMMVTWVLSGLAAYFLLGLSVGLASLLGAILVVTGPTVIGPLIRHARPKGPVGRILKYEGIINDPLGAVLALIVFQLIQVERVDTAASVVAWGVLRAILAGGVVGIAGSLIFSQGKRRGLIPSQLENAVLIALSLAVYATSNQIQPEAGLLSVTVMGMILASSKKLDVSANVEFAEHLRTMLISVLFILLTARMSAQDLAHVPFGGLGFVLALVLVVRPAAVFLSTWGAPLSLKEKTFLALMAPRGIVAAAVSSVFALRLSGDGIAEASILLPITFVVISVGVVVYGLGARPLVRFLGLDEPEPQGVLLLGDHILSLKIAEGLKASGRTPMFVSAERRRVLRLRKLGYVAEYGHLQSENLLDRLELEKIGCMIAMTPSDDKNTLSCVQFSRILGRDAVAQVSFAESEASQEEHSAVHTLRGHTFGNGVNYEELLRLSHRATAKVTKITESFSYEDFRQHYGAAAYPVMLLRDHKPPRMFKGEPPRPGERLLSLIVQDSETVVDAA